MENEFRPCPYCGKDAYSLEAKSQCPGPSVEQMHANLVANLQRFNFLTEIPANYEC